MHPLDLADEAAIHALVREVKPRTIHHFGAILSGPAEADPQAAIRANAYGTHALLEAARLNDVEQFLFAIQQILIAVYDDVRAVEARQSNQIVVVRISRDHVTVGRRIGDDISTDSDRSDEGRRYARREPSGDPRAPQDIGHLGEDRRAHDQFESLALEPRVDDPMRRTPADGC